MIRRTGSQPRFRRGGRPFAARADNEQTQSVSRAAWIFTFARELTLSSRDNEVYRESRAADNRVGREGKGGYIDRDLEERERERLVARDNRYLAISVSELLLLCNARDWKN